MQKFQKSENWGQKGKKGFGLSGSAGVQEGKCKNNCLLKIKKTTTYRTQGLLKGSAIFS